MSIARLLNRVCTTSENILAIGRRHSWVINARPSHTYHFVGTRACAGSNDATKRNQQMERLKNLALRYTSPGAMVHVYWLH